MGRPDTLPYLTELARRNQDWEKEVTLQSVLNIGICEPKAFIHRIAPTPLLMIVAEEDVTVPTASQHEAFATAKEPKTMAVIKDCEHFDLYFGEKLEENMAVQLDFLKATVGKVGA